MTATTIRRRKMPKSNKNSTTSSISCCWTTKCWQKTWKSTVKTRDLKRTSTKWIWFTANTTDRNRELSIPILRQQVATMKGFLELRLTQWSTRCSEESMLRHIRNWWTTKQTKNFSIMEFWWTTFLRTKAQMNISFLCTMRWIYLPRTCLCLLPEPWKIKMMLNWAFRTLIN